MAYKPRRLGHVNLWAQDSERSQRFYADVLGLQSTEHRPGFAAFMSANPLESHEIALIQLSPDAHGQELNQVGINHVAWRMETFEDLQEIYVRLREKGIATRIGDHGISLGVYFQDPDGNGSEAYYELPMEQWPKGDSIFTGHFPMSLED